ncbi:V2 [Emilia yellow vein Fujian virus]|uniref:Protein V2 n=1 Tax=Emilia yellow vein Fujian virus TaxID=2496575 RepID=A0A3S8V3H8_9GEMI|nr:V2 [Emilia yellow vein Fujian virus]AZL94847.1 V2 [Emilia yellow vein Fujian virus]
MWDPLLNEFPDTVHGLRCMLAKKYVPGVQKTYSPDTIGYDLFCDLIHLLNTKNYEQASSRYSHFYSRLQGTPPSELRHPLFQSCCCPHCPRHKQKASMDTEAHVSEAQTIQNVQKP